MIVSVVTTWYPTDRAPQIGTFVARDVAALAAAGHDVRLVHLVAPAHDDGRRSLIVDGVRVRRRVMDPRRMGHVWRAARALPDLIAGSELVHSMAVSALLPLALRTARCRIELPWVHTEHWSGFTGIGAPDRSGADQSEADRDGSGQSEPGQSGASLADRLAAAMGARVIARPDVVVAVSSVLAEALRRHRRGPVEVVGNVVPEAAGLADGPRNPATLRLVAVGSLVAGKRPLLAVQTVAELRRRGVTAELTWVGDGPLRGEVEAHIDALGLRRRVHLAGAVPPEEVPARLAAADYFLLPTAHETFCVAAAEAIRHGLPVILGDRGGQRDFVRPGNGVFVAGQGAADYAEAVLVAQERFAHVPRSRVAATLERRFTPEAWAQDYAQVYARAVALRGR